MYFSFQQNSVKYCCCIWIRICILKVDPDTDTASELNTDTWWYRPGTLRRACTSSIRPSRHGTGGSQKKFINFPTTHISNVKEITAKKEHDLQNRTSNDAPTWKNIFIIFAGSWQTAQTFSSLIFTPLEHYVVQEVATLLKMFSVQDSGSNQQYTFFKCCAMAFSVRNVFPYCTTSAVII